MTTETIRSRYARSIRTMSTLDAATQLLEAFERECLDWPNELTEIEQLPDWRKGTLLTWIMKAPTPPQFSVEDVLCCRQMQLIGALAKAAEQAANMGDGRTARAMAKLALGTLIDLKGTDALAVALGMGEVETPNA